jgi:hypothetical protein
MINAESMAWLPNLRVMSDVEVEKDNEEQD